MNLFTHLIKQGRWAKETFGGHLRTEGNIAHILKEIEEVRAEPHSLEEWCDIVALGFEGAMNAGHSAHAVCQELTRKLDINVNRKWHMAEDGKHMVHVKDLPTPKETPARAPRKAHVFNMAKYSPPTLEGENARAAVKLWIHLLPRLRRLNSHDVRFMVGGSVVFMRRVAHKHDREYDLLRVTALRSRDGKYAYEIFHGETSLATAVRNPHRMAHIIHYLCVVSDDPAKIVVPVNQSFPSAWEDATRSSFPWAPNMWHE